jgi:antirestriction protein ArdC
MPSPNEIRHQITAQIVEALTNGSLPPWRKPWSNDPNAPGLHTSLSTSNPYRGINQLLLQVAAMRGKFQSKWWGTFNQIRASGAHVLKGERGTHIVLFKPIKRTRVDETGEEKDDSFCVLRTFTPKPSPDSRLSKTSPSAMLSSGKAPRSPTAQQSPRPPIARMLAGSLHNNS